MTIWDKIKNFFKRFWYVILVPVGAFLIHLFVGSKKDAKLKEKEKIQKEEVKETKAEVEKTVEVVETTEAKVEQAVDKVQEVIKEDLKDKAVRDEKANKYLPNL